MHISSDVRTYAPRDGNAFEEEQPQKCPAGCSVEIKELEDVKASLNAASEGVITPNLPL